MNNTFVKSERLAKKSEFKNVFENGKIFSNDDVVSYVVLNRKQYSRLGVIVKKSIGNAVKRNRIKRLFREAFRINKCHLASSVDIIIIPRTRSKEITYLLAAEFLKDLIMYIRNGCKSN